MAVAAREAEAKPARTSGTTAASAGAGAAAAASSAATAASAMMASLRRGARATRVVAKNANAEEPGAGEAQPQVGEDQVNGSGGPQQATRVQSERDQACFGPNDI